MWCYFVQGRCVAYLGWNKVIWGTVTLLILKRYAQSSLTFYIALSYTLTLTLLSWCVTNNWTAVSKMCVFFCTLLWTFRSRDGLDQFPDKYRSRIGLVSTVLIYEIELVLKPIKKCLPKEKAWVTFVRWTKSRHQITLSANQGWSS